jgi:hypothetical protein
MDYEHLIVGSARVVELAGVAVLLLGALLAHKHDRCNGQWAQISLSTLGLSALRALVRGDADPITDLDYSAARSLRDLIDDLDRRGVKLVFGRVNPYLRADMDRHGITAAIGEACIFKTLHEALAAVRPSQT